jgi:hypothetical protein
VSFHRGSQGGCQFTHPQISPPITIEQLSAKQTHRQKIAITESLQQADALMARSTQLSRLTICNARYLEVADQLDCLDVGVRSAVDQIADSAGWTTPKFGPEPSPNEAKFC